MSVTIYKKFDSFFKVQIFALLTVIQHIIYVSHVMSVKLSATYQRGSVTDLQCIWYPIE